MNAARTTDTFLQGVIRMVLVNEAQGYRVCLECHDVLESGDEEAWLKVHLGPDGCEAREKSVWERAAQRLHVRAR